MPTPAKAATHLMLLQRRDTVAPRHPDARKIRRYRLARVQLNENRAGSPSGTAHLRRMYD
ncbi:MAG: hypothetical protein ABI950_08005 [Solirubrobacteraceae bacterium]